MRVKICCISSIKEAQLAISHGATELGLVGPMPSGPGIISNELIAEIAKEVQKPIETFLLTSETQAKEVIKHHSKVNTSTIQLVDYLQLNQYTLIREALPHINLVQVIHVLSDQDVDRAKEISPLVDMILLDSGNPNQSTKSLGGTGKTHNWDISLKIKNAIDIPLFLAGGLHPTNVADAIRHVGPDGVDLCSGVRSNNKLDATKLAHFFREVKLATTNN